MKADENGAEVKASFSEEHLSLLFGVCDLETPLGFRDYTLMLVLLDTGIRFEELCRLILDDVHDDYLKIHGKGRKEREVGFTPTTAKFLWKYINLHRAAESEAVRALFTNTRGRRMSPSGIEQIFDKIAEVAGLGEEVVVTPHKLRHTFARTWLERGGGCLQPLAAHGPQQRQDHRDLPGGLQEPPGARTAHAVLASEQDAGAPAGPWTPYLPAWAKKWRREAAQRQDRDGY